MSNQNPQRGGISGFNLVLGIILVLLGLLFLAGQLFGSFFDLNIMGYAWPLFVIVPGVVLFILAFTVEVNAGRALAIAGSIVTATGLLLLIMNITDLWAAWAYAWALIFPTSIGVGLVIFGLLKNRPADTRSGMSMALIGFGIFLVAAFFFEFLIGLNGLNFGLGRYCWPVLLILLGLAFLIYNFLPIGRKSGQ
jgi:hypothetical protein